MNNFKNSVMNCQFVRVFEENLYGWSRDVSISGVRRAAAVLYLLHVHDLRKRTDGEHTRRCRR